MEANASTKSNIVREITFTLTPEEFEPYLTKRYETIRSRAKIKGYRPGHAPLSLIKKMYGKTVDDEAIEEVIQNVFGKYATDNDLKPFGTPLVTRMDRKDDGGVEFDVTYEVLPEIELQDYRGLKGRKIFHVVTPEEIEREIEWHRERNRTEEDVDIIGDENHTAVVDFQKLDESGAPIIGEVSRDIPVDLRNENVNEDIRKALIGKKLDETARISLPTGEDGDLPYEMTVKEIKQVVLPEVDAAFAAKITGEEDSDENDLRDMIKQAIEAEYEGQYANVFRDQLIENLASLHPDIQVPSTLIMQIIDGFLNDEKKRYPNNEIPENFPMREFIGQNQERARQIGVWLLLRDAIAAKEGIAATDEDYEALAQMDAQRIGMDATQLLDVYKKNEQVEQRIVAEKVIQLLADYAEVEDEIEDVEWEKQMKAEQEAAEAAEKEEATAEKGSAGDESSEENSEATESEEAEESTAEEKDEA